jgi:hypothetical protein
VIRKLITEMVNTYEVTAKPEKAVLFNKLLEALD